MLGSGCFKCCARPCREQLFEAKGVEVTVSAPDVYWWQVRRLTWDQCGYTVGHRYAEASWFPGSLYSGTFSLTKVTDLTWRKTWRYTYPTAGQVCAGAYIEIDIQQAKLDEYPIYLNNVFHRFFWRDLSTETPRQAAAFDCTTVNTAPVTACHYELRWTDYRASQIAVCLKRTDGTETQITPQTLTQYAPAVGSCRPFPYQCFVDPGLSEWVSGGITGPVETVPGIAGSQMRITYTAPTFLR